MPKWRWKAEHVNAIVVRFHGEEVLSIYNENVPRVTARQKKIARIVVAALTKAEP